VATSPRDAGPAGPEHTSAYRPAFTPNITTFEFFSDYFR